MLKMYMYVALTISLMGLVFSCISNPGLSSLEKRSQNLNQIIMCPVCPGESIDQSQHPLAVQMRGIVSMRIQDDWTDEQILSSFVDSYGEMVLLEPSRSGTNVILWVIPPLVLLLAVTCLILTLRHMTRNSGVNTDGDIRDANLTDDDHALYLSSVEEFGADAVDGPGKSTNVTDSN